MRGWGLPGARALGLEAMGEDEHIFQGYVIQAIKTLDSEVGGCIQKRDQAAWARGLASPGSTGYRGASCNWDQGSSVEPGCVFCIQKNHRVESLEV